MLHQVLYYFFIGKSCRIRWLNQLNPGVDKTPFSVEEKRRLLLLHREFGNRWSVIVSYFPGRTDNQVKNQYHILVGTRNKKAPGTASSYGHLENGSRGSSQYQPIECSQFSEVTSLGTNNHGFAPSFSATGPFFNGGGSSSVYGKGKNSIFTPRPHQRKSHGDSMISDANTAGIQGHNYIDFLGVGRSN